MLCKTDWIQRLPPPTPSSTAAHPGVRDLLVEHSFRRFSQWQEAPLDKAFLKDVQSALAGRCPGRRVIDQDGTYWLGEPATAYRHVFDAEKRPVSEKINEIPDE